MFQSQTTVLKARKEEVRQTLKELSCITTRNPLIIHLCVYVCALMHAFTQAHCLMIKSPVSVYVRVLEVEMLLR